MKIIPGGGLAKAAGRALIGAAAMLLPAMAMAASARVESVTIAPPIVGQPLQWKTQGRGPGAGTRVETSMVTGLRLNTATWAGRSGRVYLYLPPQAIGPVTIAWETQGRMLSGRLVSGDRTLVYSGTIPPVLEDYFRFKLETDGTRLSRPHRLQFTFEIDVE